MSIIEELGSIRLEDDINEDQYTTDRKGNDQIASNQNGATQEWTSENQRELLTRRDEIQNYRKADMTDTEYSRVPVEEIQHTESQYGLRRQKKVTEKGLVYKKDTLFQRRSKMHSRLVRKSSAINDLLYSKENISMVKEEMCLLDDLFKMLMGLNNEYQQLLDESQREVNDDWFDELDQNVCTFKRKIHHWLKENNEDQQSIHTKGKMSSSKASSKSSASSKTSA